MKMKVVNANRILSIFAVLLLICGLLGVCYAQDTSEAIQEEVIQEEADPKLDLNDDGTINILDLVLVASSFGERGENDADVNDDGVVNILDLVLVAGAFGRSVAAPTDDTPETAVTGPSNTNVDDEPEPPMMIGTPGTLSISEIMYAAEKSFSPPQWIELYNSGSKPISLRGWTVLIENQNTPDLTDSENATVEITFEDNLHNDVPTVYPYETVLIISSGAASDDEHQAIPEHKVYDLYWDSDSSLGLWGSMLSVEAFSIKLINSEGNVVDKAGNFDGETRLWQFDLGHRGLSRDGHRISVMRLYSKGVALDGTKKESWIPATKANLTEKQRTYYGNKNDIGSPGIAPDIGQ